MKNHFRTWSRTLIVSFLLMACGRSLAAEPTALSLVKEGNKHVGEDAKDRIVQIWSEKSVGTMTPNIWHIVYYDPDASLKATEVVFAGGKKQKVTRPARLLEPITRSHKQLDRSKIKIDSDRAIETAIKDPLLNNLKLTNTQLWLERGEDAPHWKVRLWAQRVHDATRTAEIGQVYISADDGKVIERDLHINRAD